MATKRKTFEVAVFKDWVNSILALPTKDNSHTPSQDEKKALCTALERVLMDTGNYHGFNSVKWLNGGCGEWEAAGKPDFPEKNQFLGLEYDRYYF